MYCNVGRRNGNNMNSFMLFIASILELSSTRFKQFSWHTERVLEFICIVSSTRNHWNSVDIHKIKSPKCKYLPELNLYNTGCANSCIENILLRDKNTLGNFMQTPNAYPTWIWLSSLRGTLKRKVHPNQEDHKQHREDYEVFAREIWTMTKINYADLPSKYEKE